MIEGYGTIRGLADAEELIIPGHDPLVVERFPCPDATFAGEIVRLDRGPAGFREFFRPGLVRAARRGSPLDQCRDR